MNRNRAYIVAAALVLCGCGVDPSAEPASPLALEPTRPSPDRVWVTIDADAVDATRRAVAIDGLPQLVLEPTSVIGDVAVVELAAADLPVLTTILHEQRRRCGGYVAHTTRADAIAAAEVAMLPRPIYAGGAFAIDNPDGAELLMAAVSADEVLATIEGLSAFPTRFHSTSSGTEAAVWLRDRWIDAAGDRTDISVELIDHDSSSQPSVAMTIVGTEFPDEQVVMGGHLDSVSFGGGMAPGADDDASGVAVVGEVGRAIAATDFRPARTVKLYAYAAEEVGLRGSAEIAEAAEAAGTPVVAVMQLDMVNFRGSALDMVLIDDFTDATLNQFVGELIDEYVGATWEYDSCGYGCSDHASWTRAGFAAVTPFEARTADINDALHTPGDTLDRSGNNADHAEPFARLAAAYIAEVAKGGVRAGPECTDATPCPAGQMCADGACVDVPPGPDAGADPEPSIDAGVPGDPGPEPDAATGDPATPPDDGEPELAAGCGCTSTPDGGRSHGGLLLVGLVALGLARLRHPTETQAS